MGSVELVDQAVQAARRSALHSTSVPKSREWFEMAANAFERLADLAAAFTGATSAYAIYASLHIGRQLQYPAFTVLSASFDFAIVFVLMLNHDGAYERGNSLLRIRETERILRVSTQTFGVLFPISFFFLQPFSRWIVVLALVLVPLLLVVEKQFMFVAIRHLHKRG